MKRFQVLLVALLTATVSLGQKMQDIISVADISRIEKMLSSDSMEGRKAFTPGIEKAADFIALEFSKANLGFYDTLSTYRQQFNMVKQAGITLAGRAGDAAIPAENIVAVGTETHLKIDENSGFLQENLDSVVNFFQSASAYIKRNQPAIVWVSKKNATNFQRLSLFNNRTVPEGAAPVIFVLADEKPATFSFEINRKVEKAPLANVVGVIPGKSKKDEYVIFSAHYDHLGIGKPDARGDSIYNGANDNASGTTAVIMLAKYFNTIKDNERTIVFVAFTAEEIGGFGSRYFSQHISPEKVMAMFNIEMIGTESKWGKGSAYITGYERSSLGNILQQNLSGTRFQFEPDPYPEQQLFFRSDNATLAALGVPAHTISTAKMDIEPHYHKQSDEVETLDLNNMTEIIKAIALSSKSIVNGQDTPSRVKL